MSLLNSPGTDPMQITRRQFLGRSATGIGAAALASLLNPKLLGAPGAARSLLPHFAPRAKRVIWLTQAGAPSQLDLFDHKPQLRARFKEELPGSVRGGQRLTGMTSGQKTLPIAPSLFEFKPHGKSGIWLSDLLPHTAGVVDELCVVRSLHTDTAAHASGCIQLNTGSVQIGKPCLGSWLSYGLGSLNDSLPSFVVMTDPRGGPIGSASNWTAGFMPAAFQGTLFRSQGTPLLDLATPPGVTPGTQRDGLDLLARLNQEHLRTRPGDSELSARIASYELAYRMQTTASDVVRIDREGARTRSLYGLDNARTADFGRKCLITRRLLESGVRFIQLYSGGGHLEETWDGHSDCISNHRLHAGETDQPIAALITDLKRIGLWDETLLVWGGEFGRTPTSEGVGRSGRDHNPFGFSMWLAGAGVRGGQAIGGTDELGFHAVDEPYHISDLHATILHLMGLDHERLSYFYQGLDQRLTGVETRRLVRGALA